MLHVHYLAMTGILASEYLKSAAIEGSLTKMPSESLRIVLSQNKRIDKGQIHRDSGMCNSKECI